MIIKSFELFVEYELNFFFLRISYDIANTDLYTRKTSHGRPKLVSHVLDGL